MVGWMLQAMPVHVRAGGPTRARPALLAEARGVGDCGSCRGGSFHGGCVLVVGAASSLGDMRSD